MALPVLISTLSTPYHLQVLRRHIRRFKMGVMAELILGNEQVQKAYLGE